MSYLCIHLFIYIGRQKGWCIESLKFYIAIPCHHPSRQDLPAIHFEQFIRIYLHLHDADAEHFLQSSKRHIYTFIHKITREYYMPSTSYERRKHNRKGWIFRGVGGTKLCQECAISERTKRVLRLHSRMKHLFIYIRMLMGYMYTKIRRGLLFRFRSSSLSLSLYLASSTVST